MAGTSIFCLRCGHENPAQNRYCGMCGGVLVRPRSAEGQGEALAGQGAAPEESPFNPHGYQRSDPTFSYIYGQDEEKRSHWGLYLLAAFVAIAGFVIAYQWGKPSFDTSKILAVLQRPEKKSDQQPQSDQRPKTEGEQTAQSGAAPPVPGATHQPPGGRSAETQTTVARPEDSASGSGASGSAGESKHPTPAPSEHDIPPGVTPPPAGSAASDTGAGEKNETQPDAPPPAAKETTTPIPAAPDRSGSDDAAHSQELATRQQQAADDELVDLAQTYLYGRGVPRDCDRALTYLRRASGSSAKAKTQLGALYATGQCVPLDRPTSHHWFALAFRTDPRNSYLERNLQMLWNQMTPDEKQRALRMAE